MRLPCVILLRGSITNCARTFRRRTIIISVLACIGFVTTTGCARWRGFTARFSSVETLCQMLDDERNYSTQLGGSSSSPSIDAAAALEKKGANAVMPVIHVLEHSTNSWARQHAAGILGMIRDPRAVKPLITALRDENGNVRAVSADSLAEFKDPSAIDPLMASLQDTDWRVRAAAANALRSCCRDDPRIIGPLRALVTDESEHVRREATKALGEILERVREGREGRR
jgi:HEAT repeat protein